MATLEQPELRRDGDDPLPADNLPGHHPEEEQDKPDPDAFVAKAREVAARSRAVDAAPPLDAAATAPAPVAAPSQDSLLAAIAKLQWKVATFPARLTIAAVRQIRHRR